MPLSLFLAYIRRFPQLDQLPPCGPDSGLGQVCSAFVDGPHLEPHCGGNHFWEQLQLDQHVESTHGVVSHQSAAPSVAKKEEAALDGKLDVGVVAVTHEPVADGARVGVLCALGERPRGECERVCKAASEPNPECCAVCVPRGSHCGRPLASHWVLVG